MAKPNINSLPDTFTKLVVFREYRPEAGSMSSYDVLKKVTYTKNPDGAYSAVTEYGENVGKLSPKEAQAAYKYKVPMGTIAEPDTGPSKVSENKPASQKPIGAKADKAAKPAADKQTKANLAATNSAPKANSVSKGSLGAFQKWGEALPEGDTKEAARELYRKAKAGEISQTDLQKLQAELQAQVDKRKAAAEAKSAPKETKPKAESKPKAETKVATPETRPTDKPAKTEAPKTETSASKEAQPEKPKKAKAPRGTKNALGYETFPEKAQAELRAGGSNRERLGKALRETVGKANPIGPYVAGETFRKGLGSAKNIKAGAVGTAISAATAAPDVYDAVVTKKGQDPEANRRAKRQAAQAVGAGIGTWAGGALGGMATTPTVAGVPVGVAAGATGGGIAGEKIAGAIYDRFDPPPVVEKLETKTQPTPVEPEKPAPKATKEEIDRIYNEALEKNAPLDEILQKQKDKIDSVPLTILEQKRQDNMASASMGPSSKPVGMYNEPPSGIGDILSPENPDENFNRLLQMQDYARSNPAANLRKKRIMQVGLDAAETGTFRARRPDRYTVVV